MRHTSYALIKKSTKSKHRHYIYVFNNENNIKPKTTQLLSEFVS